jgi:plasmid replication initiation protein
MATSPRSPGERRQLDFFRARPEDFSPHDQRDLMERPFFSLAKSKRLVPIDYEAGGVHVRVEPSLEHGMATIWDADVLIWAASQIVDARDKGLATSRLLRFTPYQLLTFVARGVSARDYHRLKAALDRLQSTSVVTDIRAAGPGRRHRFSWLNEWIELTEDGRPAGLELVLPDWLYRGVLDRSLNLSLDPAYFRLTGGIERWLYRVVRKHGGRQPAGWSFPFRRLHEKSASLSRFANFAVDLRAIAARQNLPGYWLEIRRTADEEHLHFTRRDLLAPDHPGWAPLRLRGSRAIGEGTHG